MTPASVVHACRARPRAVLGTLVAVVLALGAAAPFTRWDADPELLTLSGSPELRAYRDFLSRFGSDELVVIGYEDPDLLRPAGLSRLRALTDALWDVPGVAAVSSLDTLYAVDVGPFGPFARPLVPDDLSLVPDPATLRSSVRELPMARDTLLDASGTVTTVVVRPEAHSLDRAARERQQGMLEGIEVALGDARFRDLDFHLAGAPVFNRELQRLNARDAAIFTPLTLLLVAGILAAALRSLWAVLASLACVLGTLAIVRGTMTVLGVPLSTTTSLLPPLLMVVAVSVSVHVLARYGRERARGRSVEESLRTVEHSVLAPAGLTALTTAIGFGSLLAADIPSLRTFGAFAALGVLVSFVLGAVGIPAALRVRAPRTPVGARRDLADRFLGGLRAGTRARAVPVVLVAGLACAVGIAGASRVRVATHDGDFFPPDHPLNQAYRFIESRLAGVTPLEAVVRARTPHGLRTPEALEAIRRVQGVLSSEVETTAAVSIVDWIDLARRATQPEAERGQPLDADAVERAAFVLEATSGADLPYWIQEDWSLARISTRVVALDSRENTALLDRLKAGVRRELGANPPVEVTLTGLVPVFARMEQVLLHSQITSFTLALGAVFVVFLGLFRSPRIAVLALVPNLVPIVCTLGIMGASGTPLDVVTVMVASVNLGIIVDDTIHLLHAVREGIAQGMDPEAAVDRALERVGRAVVFTSVVLGLGFAVLLLSDFRPTARFGGLTALTVVLALAADLTLLPALIRVARPFGTAPRWLSWREETR